MKGRKIKLKGTNGRMVKLIILIMSQNSRLYCTIRKAPPVGELNGFTSFGVSLLPSLNGIVAFSRNV